MYGNVIDAITVTIDALSNLSQNTPTLNYNLA